MKFILGNKLIYRYMYCRDMYDDKLGIMYNVLFERMKLVKRYGVWIKNLISIVEKKLWLILLINMRLFCFLLYINKLVI